MLKAFFQQRIMFIETFITYLRVERGSSPHTLKAYETDLRDYAEYLKSVDETLEPADSDRDLVRGWMAKMMDKGCAINSVCRKLSSLRAFFLYIKGKGIIAEDPTEGLRGPKKRKQLPVFIKEEEMEELFDNQFSEDGFLDTRNRTIISCFYEMGIRLSELCGLNVADVDFSEKQVKVLGKRSKERIVPFGSSLREQIAEYIELRNEIAPNSENALFISERGGRISHSQVYRMVRSNLARVSTVKRRGPHTLRHTFATTMLNNNAELGAVKELLGHEQLATTEVYTHVTFEELKKVYKMAHPRAD